MKKITGFFSIGFLLLIIFSCQKPSELSLQNGDLLFVSAKDSALSGAINRVTQTEEQTHYSHIGLLEKDENSKFWVLHAGPQNGSERISLDEFINYSREDHTSIDVYRLKDPYQKTIPPAIEEAKKWLNKPYNFTYVLSDEKLYCSDFVQRSFSADSIFDLEPMTFMDPKTGKPDEVWVEFYQKQQIPIPEGKPGCNPNGMAASNKISFIKTLEF